MDERQSVQSGALHIGSISRNRGHIGHIYGNVDQRRTVIYGAPIVPLFERQSLLKRVRKIWISGVLEPSLKGAAFIPLGLYDRTDLIEEPLQDIMQEVQRPEGSLPAGTSIDEVFDESEGTLLILGEPGSGKTTLLLQLARTLLERANHDQTHPMPVVFNLSTWTLKRQPLAEWLVEELKTRYQMPQEKGRAWIEKGQLLPLLDGLDEVAADYRGACIAAINMYLQQQGHVPVIIGSRVAEYTAQAAKLVVRRAIVAQALSVQQVREYLQQADGNFEALLELLSVDPGFQEFAKNPLMLSILKQTYQGRAVQLARSDSLEEQRRQIFADYVERMLQRRGRLVHYTPERTKYWLTWLAKRMRQQNQTVFYLENLQLTWLEHARPVEVSTSLAFAFLTFPIAAIVLGLEYTVNGPGFAVVNGVLTGLLGAMVAFFYVWLIETDFRLERLFPGRKQSEQVARRTPENRGIRGKFTAFFTPLFWERACYALLSGLLLGVLVQVLVGPLYAMINGMFIAAFLVVLGKFERTIRPAEQLVWSWRSLVRHAVVSMCIGVGIGVLGGIFDAFPYLQQMSVFLTTLYYWLSLGGALGLIIILMRGFTSSELDKRQKDIRPNQGIMNSLSNSLRLGLSSGLLLGVVVFSFYSYVMHNVFVVGYINDIPPNSDVIYGVGDAVAVSYLFWLINGGFATVQHLMLRIRLWRMGDAPWRYPRFLDYAQQRILLRRVGGGYIFVHKLLLEYFARLDLAESAWCPAETGIQPEVAFALPDTSGDDQEDLLEEPTVPLIHVPAVSDVPLVLPCGHTQYNPQARFCSMCGRPVSAQEADQ